MRPRSSLVPDAHSGNMDTPEMRAGTTYYLGVNVEHSSRSAMAIAARAKARPAARGGRGRTMELCSSWTSSRAGHTVAPARGRRPHHVDRVGSASRGRLPDRAGDLVRWLVEEHGADTLDVPGGHPDLQRAGRERATRTFVAKAPKRYLPNGEVYASTHATLKEIAAAATIRTRNDVVVPGGGGGTLSGGQRARGARDRREATVASARRFPSRILTLASVKTHRHALLALLATSSDFDCLIVLSIHRSSAPSLSIPQRRSRQMVQEHHAASTLLVQPRSPSRTVWVVHECLWRAGTPGPARLACRAGPATSKRGSGDLSPGASTTDRSGPGSRSCRCSAAPPHRGMQDAFANLQVPRTGSGVRPSP